MKILEILKEAIKEAVKQLNHKKFKRRAVEIDVYDFTKDDCCKNLNILITDIIIDTEDTGLKIVENEPEFLRETLEYIRAEHKHLNVYVIKREEE